MKRSLPATAFVVAFLSIGASFDSAAADESVSAAELAESRELPATPGGVAPLAGLARALPKDPDDSRDYAWSLRLHVPKVVWEVVGEERPKLEWSEIRTAVEMVTLDVAMGYSEATQLAEQAQNRVVDLDGRRLRREEALRRLAEKTPVLVSVSGEMPDPFYLQCSKPDTLIVLIGLPSSREYHLLPTSGTTRPLAPARE